jgi:hypothetical protein
MKSLPIVGEIKEFLFRPNYFETPLPLETMEFLKKIYENYDGSTCVKQTFKQFIGGLEDRLIHQEYEADHSIREKFLKNVLGRTMGEANEFDLKEFENA